MNKSTNRLLFEMKLNPRKAISKLNLSYHDSNRARWVGEFVVQVSAKHSMIPNI